MPGHNSNDKFLLREIVSRTWSVFWRKKFGFIGLGLAFGILFFLFSVVLYSLFDQRLMPMFRALSTTNILATFESASSLSILTFGLVLGMTSIVYLLCSTAHSLLLDPSLGPQMLFRNCWSFRPPSLVFLAYTFLITGTFGAVVTLAPYALLSVHLAGSSGDVGIGMIVPYCAIAYVLYFLELVLAPRFFITVPIAVVEKTPLRASQRRGKRLLVDYTASFRNLIRGLMGAVVIVFVIAIVWTVALKGSDSFVWAMIFVVSGLCVPLVPLALILSTASYYRLNELEKLKKRPSAPVELVLSN